MNSEILKQLQLYWDKLESREKTLLISMVVVIVFFLVYLLFWLPVTRDLRKLRVTVPKAEAALAVMRVQAAKIKTLQATGSTAGNKGGILSRLEQAATQKGLRQHISKMEPDGDSGVRITVEGASLNNLLSLLSTLHQSSGLRVENATISPVPEAPGTINARLVLKGSGT